MSKTIDDARQLIESRLADLDAEVKRLERAVGSLGEGGGQGRRRLGRPAKGVTAKPAAPSKPKRRASRKPKGAKRAMRGQRQEEFLAAVGSNPGARPSELATTIEIRPTQVHALIANAKAQKLIVKRGKGYALKV